MSELKSQSITKEMWQQIEKEMSDGWVNIVFAYKGHELTVNRVRVSESKTCLQVYIDGSSKVNGLASAVIKVSVIKHLRSCLTFGVRKLGRNTTEGSRRQ